MPSKRRCIKLWAPDHKMGEDKVKAMNDSCIDLLKEINDKDLILTMMLS